MGDEEKKKKRSEYGKRWYVENKEHKNKCSRNWYIANKELAKEKSKLKGIENQKLKKYVMFGNVKLIELPTNAVTNLQERFKIDETCESGLRWSDSNLNKPHKKGKEAGYFHKSSGYYHVRVFIDLVEYDLSVARVVWMIANSTGIEPGMQIDHRNKNRKDNRISNLTLGTSNLNMVNRSFGLNYYKNVFRSSRKRKPSFYARFSYLGKSYCTKSTSSEDRAFLFGWDLLTSGKVPLVYVKAQSTEWQDGTYLKRALAECKKQGIAVTPPKFKTLYEYIASVEGS
jgi:hypothetical protein